jgi:cytochrome c biogenesis protein CcmG/thiol:disulfide interchange protein DsbE
MPEIKTEESNEEGIVFEGEHRRPQRGRTFVLGGMTLSMGKILVWGLLLVFLVVIGLALRNSQRGRVAVGEPAPEFSLTTFDGQTYEVSELKGKVILINFWASWCVPCENEAAFLEAAWKYYQPRGDVLFLGVDYTDTEKAAQAYLDRFGITYPNGPDLGTRISDMYRMTGVPETFILDQDGRLADFKYGEFSSAEEIIAKIDRLLE